MTFPFGIFDTDYVASKRAHEPPHDHFLRPKAVAPGLLYWSGSVEDTITQRNSPVTVITGPASKIILTHQSEKARSCSMWVCAEK